MRLTINCGIVNRMDHSPITQTSELGKFISTARKSIINLVKYFCITRGKALRHLEMW